MGIVSGVVVQSTTQAANTVLSGPTTGAATEPGFRVLVAADIPALPASQITSGTLGLAVGGTNADLSASGSATAFLAQNGSHVVSARAIVGADLPNPSASTLGGIQSIAAVGSKWVNTISTSGVPNLTQPAFSDISGAATNADLPNGLNNNNSAAQSLTVVSGTQVYITNSNINLPATLAAGIIIGTSFRWRVAMSKTALGTGAFNISILMGTNGTTADTAIVNQSIGTQTAVVDSMIVDVLLTFTAVGAGTAAVYWSIIPTHEAATATGFGVATGATGQFSGTVGSLNSTTASLKFGLGFTATTGTPVVTVPLVMAEARNLA